MPATMALALMLTAPALRWPPVELGLVDLQGRRIEAADLRGRVVLFDVWATWCAPCLAELPSLRALEDAYPDDLMIVGVSLDTMTRLSFVSWLRRHDVTWRQHFDGRGFSSPVVQALAVEALPASFLFDRSGRLVARDLRGARLAGEVARHVARAGPGR